VKKQTACIWYCALVLGGIALSIWALMSWSENGFRIGRKISNINSEDDGYFFLCSIFIGLALIGYAYYGLKDTFCKDGYSGRLRDIIPGFAHKSHHYRNSKQKQGNGMTFSDQYDAKKFFVDKVIAQACKEGSPLSEAQKYMLNWTEVEEGFEIDDRLSEIFHSETTDKEYEERISSLLKHAYHDDISVDASAKQTYRNAYKAMKNNDHYILIMIKDALGYWF
jgi:hypothetical protein